MKKSDSGRRRSRSAERETRRRRRNERRSQEGLAMTSSPPPTSTRSRGGGGERGSGREREEMTRARGEASSYYDPHHSFDDPRRNYGASYPQQQQYPPYHGSYSSYDQRPTPPRSGYAAPPAAAMAVPMAAAAAAAGAAAATTRDRERQYSSSDTSSSTSSSYINISRKNTSQYGGFFRSFFRKPSHRNLRRRRSKRRVLGFGNSSNRSSSSVDSDLAYGEGYIKKPKSRAMSPTVGAPYGGGGGSHGRPSSFNPNDPAGRGPPQLQRTRTDEEIRAIGEELAKIARAQNQSDLAAAGVTRTSGLATAMSEYKKFKIQRQNTLESLADPDHRPTRGLGSSKPQRRRTDEDDEDWLSTDDEEDSSSDNGLAYGKAYPSSEWLPPPKKSSTSTSSQLPGKVATAAATAVVAGTVAAATQGSSRPVSKPKDDIRPPVRKSSVVDPRLFGENNSLRQFVNTPCGFGEDGTASTSRTARVEHERRVAQVEAEELARKPMRNVYPVAGSDPANVGYEASVVSGAGQQDFPQRSRPLPLPIQQPVARVPIPSKVYDAEEGGTSRPRRTSQRQSDGSTLGDAAIAGVGGVVAGVLASELMSEGKTEGKKPRRRPDGEARQEPYDPSSRENDPRTESKKQYHKRASGYDELEQAAASVRKDTVEPRDDEYNPFKYEVSPDAFETPRFGRTPKPPLTPQVVTVDREPNFGDDPVPSFSLEKSEKSSPVLASSSKPPPRMSRLDTFEIEQEMEQQRRGGSRIRSKSPAPGRGRASSLDQETHDAKAILDEVKHSTVPVDPIYQTAAHAVEAERSRERQKDNFSEDGSRDRTKQEEDPVMARANRAYREAGIAMDLARDEIRSRSESSEGGPRSVIDKYTPEEPEVITIVTPPEMQEQEKRDKGLYAEPDADVRINHVLMPHDLERFKQTHGEFLGDGEPTFRARDPSAERERPLICLVLPTPEYTPLPSPSLEEQARRVSKAAEPVEEEERPKSSPNVTIGPRGEIIHVVTAEPPADPPATEKSVSWGENETRSFQVESSSPEPPPADKPRPKLGKNSKWRLLAGAIGGIAAAEAASEAAKDKDKDKDDDEAETASKAGSEDAPLTKTADLTDAPPPEPTESSDQAEDFDHAARAGFASSLRDDDDTPPAPGPKPASPRIDQMPGAFGNDLAFAADVASGLRAVNLDENLVIDNPAFYRRDSPPGSNEPLDGYQKPFAETVTDLGVYSADSGDKSKSSPPAEDRDLHPEGWETPTRMNSKAKRKGPSISRSGVRDGPETSGETGDDSGGGSPLVTRKSRRRNKSQVVVVHSDESPAPEPREAGETEWAESSRRERKKKKGLEDSEGPIPAARRVSVPIDAFDDLQDAEPVPADPEPEPETPKKKKKGKKDSVTYDSPSKAVEVAKEPIAGDEAEWEIPTKKSKKKRDSVTYDESSRSVDVASETSSKRSKKRGSVTYDEPSRSVDVASETSSRKSKKRDSVTYDEPSRSVDAASETSSKRSSRKSRRKSGADDWGDDEDDPPDRKFKPADHDVSSVVSDPTRYDDRRSNGSRSEYGDDNKSVVSLPSSGKRGSKGKSRDEKRSSGGLFGIFGKSNGNDKDTEKEESFLDNAGILGADVGVAGAAAVVAAELSRSKAAEASPERGMHIDEAKGPSRPRSSTLTRNLEFDPEIIQRTIKPAIDPQFGDLLPLPPSAPGSPRELGEDVVVEAYPALPESRPQTPDQLELLREMVKQGHVRKKSTSETPQKPPSGTAIPIEKIWGRSVPSSPALPRPGSMMSSPLMPPETPKRLPRPKSLEGDGIRPLFLLEKKGSIQSQAVSTAASEAGHAAEDVELPPSRESPGPEYEAREHDADYLSRAIQMGSELRIDTSLPTVLQHQDHLGSQDSTPKAQFGPRLEDMLAEEAAAREAPLPIPEDLAGGVAEDSPRQPVDPTSKERSSYLMHPTPPSVRRSIEDEEAGPETPSKIRGEIPDLADIKEEGDISTHRLGALAALTGAAAAGAAIAASGEADDSDSFHDAASHVDVSAESAGEDSPIATRAPEEALPDFDLDIGGVTLHPADAADRAATPVPIAAEAETEAAAEEELAETPATEDFATPLALESPTGDKGIEAEPTPETEEAFATPLTPGEAAAADDTIVEETPALETISEAAAEQPEATRPDAIVEHDSVAPLEDAETQVPTQIDDATSEAPPTKDDLPMIEEETVLAKDGDAPGKTEEPDVATAKEIEAPIISEDLASIEDVVPREEMEIGEPTAATAPEEQPQTEAESEPSTSRSSSVSAKKGKKGKKSKKGKGKATEDEAEPSPSPAPVDKPAPFLPEESTLVDDNLTASVGSLPAISDADKTDRSIEEVETQATTEPVAEPEPEPEFTIQPKKKKGKGKGKKKGSVSDWEDTVTDSGKLPTEESSTPPDMARNDDDSVPIAASVITAEPDTATEAESILTTPGKKKKRKGSKKSVSWAPDEWSAPVSRALSPEREGGADLESSKDDPALQEQMLSGLVDEVSRSPELQRPKDIEELEVHNAELPEVVLDPDSDIAKSLDADAVSGLRDSAEETPAATADKGDDELVEEPMAAETDEAGESSTSKGYFASALSMLPAVPLAVGAALRKVTSRGSLVSTDDKAEGARSITEAENAAEDKPEFDASGPETTVEGETGEQEVEPETVPSETAPEDEARGEDQAEPEATTAAAESPKIDPTDAEAPSEEPPLTLEDAPTATVDEVVEPEPTDKSLHEDEPATSPDVADEAAGDKVSEEGLPEEEAAVGSTPMEVDETAEIPTPGGEDTTTELVEAAEEAQDSAWSESSKGRKKKGKKKKGASSIKSFTEEDSTASQVATEPEQSGTQTPVEAGDDEWAPTKKSKRKDKKRGSASRSLSRANSIAEETDIPSASQETTEEQAVEPAVEPIAAVEEATEMTTENPVPEVIAAPTEALDAGEDTLEKTGADAEGEAPILEVPETETETETETEAKVEPVPVPEPSAEEISDEAMADAPATVQEVAENPAHESTVVDDITAEEIKTEIPGDGAEETKAIEEPAVADVPDEVMAEDEQPAAAVSEATAAEEEQPTTGLPAITAEEEHPSAEASEVATAEEEQPAAEVPEVIATQEEQPTAEVLETVVTEEEQPVLDTTEESKAETKEPPSEALELTQAEQEQHVPESSEAAEAPVDTPEPQNAIAEEVFEPLSASKKKKKKKGKKGGAAQSSQAELDDVAERSAVVTETEAETQAETEAETQAETEAETQVETEAETPARTDAETEWDEPTKKPTKKEAKAAKKAKKKKGKAVALDWTESGEPESSKDASENPAEAAGVETPPVPAATADETEEVVDSTMPDAADEANPAAVATEVAEPVEAAETVEPAEAVEAVAQPEEATPAEDVQDKSLEEPTTIEPAEPDPRPEPEPDAAVELPQEEQPGAIDVAMDDKPLEVERVEATSETEAVNSEAVADVLPPEDLAIKELAVEELAVEEPAVEEPAVEVPAVEEPAVEAPAVEAPAVEESAVEESAIDHQAVEGLAAEEPAVKDPTIEDLVTEELDPSVPETVSREVPEEMSTDPDTTAVPGAAAESEPIAVSEAAPLDPETGTETFVTPGDTVDDAAAAAEVPFVVKGNKKKKKKKGGRTAVETEPESEAATPDVTEEPEQETEQQLDEEAAAMEENALTTQAEDDFPPVEDKSQKGGKNKKKKAKKGKGRNVQPEDSEFSTTETPFATPAGDPSRSMTNLGTFDDSAPPVPEIPSDFADQEAKAETEPVDEDQPVEEEWPTAKPKKKKPKGGKNKTQTSSAEVSAAATPADDLSQSLVLPEPSGGASLHPKEADDDAMPDVSAEVAVEPLTTADEVAITEPIEKSDNGPETAMEETVPLELSEETQDIPVAAIEDATGLIATTEEEGAKDSPTEGADETTVQDLSAVEPEASSDIITVIRGDEPQILDPAAEVTEAADGQAVEESPEAVLDAAKSTVTEEPFAEAEPTPTQEAEVAVAETSQEAEAEPDAFAWPLSKKQSKKKKKKGKKGQQSEDTDLSETVTTTPAETPFVDASRSVIISDDGPSVEAEQADDLQPVDNSVPEDTEMAVNDEEDKPRDSVADEEPIVTAETMVDVARSSAVEEDVVLASTAEPALEVIDKDKQAQESLTGEELTADPEVLAGTEEGVADQEWGGEIVRKPGKKGKRGKQATMDAGGPSKAKKKQKKFTAFDAEPAASASEATDALEDLPTATEMSVAESAAASSQEPADDASGFDAPKSKKKKKRAGSQVWALLESRPDAGELSVEDKDATNSATEQTRGLESDDVPEVNIIIPVADDAIPTEPATLVVEEIPANRDSPPVDPEVDDISISVPFVEGSAHSEPSAIVIEELPKLEEPAVEAASVHSVVPTVVEDLVDDEKPVDRALDLTSSILADEESRPDDGGVDLASTVAVIGPPGKVPDADQGDLDVASMVAVIGPSPPKEDLPTETSMPISTEDGTGAFATAAQEPEGQPQDYFAVKPGRKNSKKKRGSRAQSEAESAATVDTSTDAEFVTPADAFSGQESTDQPTPDFSGFAITKKKGKGKKGKSGASGSEPASRALSPAREGAEAEVSQETKAGEGVLESAGNSDDSWDVSNTKSKKKRKSSAQASATASRQLSPIRDEASVLVSEGISTGPIIDVTPSAISTMAQEPDAWSTLAGRPKKKGRRGLLYDSGDSVANTPRTSLAALVNEPIHEDLLQTETTRGAEKSTEKDIWDDDDYFNQAKKGTAFDSPSGVPPPEPADAGPSPPDDTDVLGTIGKAALAGATIAGAAGVVSSMKGPEESDATREVDLVPAQESSHIVHEAPFDQSTRPGKKKKTKDTDDVLLDQPIISSRELAAVYLDQGHHTVDMPEISVGDTAPETEEMKSTRTAEILQESRPESTETVKPDSESRRPTKVDIPERQQPSARDIAASYLEHDHHDTKRGSKSKARDSPIEVEEESADVAALKSALGGGVAMLAAKFGDVKKPSKKGKSGKKRVVDNRQPREDDIFDDAVVWEGSERKALDDGESSRAQDDGFWNVSGSAKTESDDGGAMTRGHAEEAVEPKGKGKEIATDVDEESPRLRELGVPERTSREHMDDDSLVDSTGNSPKAREFRENVKEEDARVDDMTPVTREDDDSTPKPLHAVQHLPQIVAATMDVDPTVPRGLDVASHEEEYTTKSDVTRMPVDFADTVPRSLEAEPAGDFSSGTPHTDYMQDVDMPDFGRSLSRGLPPVQEEEHEDLEEEYQPKPRERPRAIPASPEVNRDSGFMTDSPHPMRRANFGDQGHIRDSGLGMHNWPEGAPPRRESSSRHSPETPIWSGSRDREIQLGNESRPSEKRSKRSPLVEYEEPSRHETPRKESSHYDTPRKETPRERLISKAPMLAEPSTRDVTPEPLKIHKSTSGSYSTPEPRRSGQSVPDLTPEVYSHSSSRAMHNLTPEPLRTSKAPKTATAGFSSTPDPHRSGPSLSSESPELRRSMKSIPDLSPDVRGPARALHDTTPESAKPRSVSDGKYAGLGLAVGAAAIAGAAAASQRSVSDSAEHVARRSLSNTSLSRRRTPEPLRFRPESPGIRSATPPLRRVDKRMSGDLRQRSKVDLAKEAAAGERSAQNNTPVANEGRARATAPETAPEMTDVVFDGYGEGRIGSPRSPTRPHSMRRRQSMQVLELESRVEQLMAENRALADARAQAEHGLSNRASAVLAERDNEIDSLKQSLDFLQREVQRLTEVNTGLSSANAALATQHDERYHLLETTHAAATRELDEFRTSRSGHQSILDEKNAEIEQLKAQLDEAKEQIRQMQQRILAENKPSASDDFLAIRDVDHFDQRCQQLCSHVQQWVLRFSKFSDMRACRLTSEINEEKIIDRLDNAMLDGSDVDTYLNDRVRRRDIFMSMTMNMIWEFVFTRYLFGMDREQRQKLKSLEKLLNEVGPPQAVRQWRAVTLTLLARRDTFRKQRDLDTEAVVQAIFQTLSTILPPPSNLEEQIQSQLRRVMREAVDLSIEMRTQRAEYMMLPPLQPEYDEDGELAETVAFNASLMNERSGDDSIGNNDRLEARGAVVRIVLFPLVVKKGDDQGVGDDEIVVCPAQVLVAKDKGKNQRQFTATPISEPGGASLKPPATVPDATDSIGSPEGSEVTQVE